MDDIFTGLTYFELMSFFQKLNSRHPNVKFTTDAEKDKQLPFLNIFIGNIKKNLTTSIFQKSGLGWTFIILLTLIPLLKM